MKVYLRHMPSTQTMEIIPGPQKPPRMRDPVLATGSSGPTKGHRGPDFSDQPCSPLSHEGLALSGCISFIPWGQPCWARSVAWFFQRRSTRPHLRGPACTPGLSSQGPPFSLHPMGEPPGLQANVHRWGFLPAPPPAQQRQVIEHLQPQCLLYKVSYWGDRVS